MVELGIVSQRILGQGRHNGGLREDGTPKGMGFLGQLKRPDGKVSTELSIGVEFDGKEFLIPSLVPTLTKEEIDFLLTQDEVPVSEWPESILRKAEDHAKKRLRMGLSPFAQDSTGEFRRTGL